MEPLFIAFVLAVFFTAAFLKGVTGLGFATLGLGFLASVAEVKAAIPLVILPSLTSNILVMRDAGSFKDVFKRFWPLYLSALPGLLLGLWLLSTIQSDAGRMVLGLVMVLYGAWSLWRGQGSLSPRWGKLLMTPVGVCSGFVNGLTGSQVMPILPYLLSLNLDKNVLVQSINTSFTLSSLIMLAGMGRLGLITWQVLALSAAGIIPVALGIHLGGRVRRLVSQELFRTLVLVMLVLLGASLVLRILL